MTRKPNIIIICPFFRPNLGGVETHLDLLTQYLCQHYFPTTVLTYRPLTTPVHRYLSREKSPYLSIYRFWWFGLGLFDKLTPYPILQFLYTIPGLLFHSLVFMIKNHQRANVIHAHGFSAAFIVRVIKLFFPKIRAVVSTHFIYKKINPKSLYGRFFKWVMLPFDHYLLISRLSKKELTDLGLNPQKMSIFHHWLDQSIFFPKDKLLCRQLLGIPPTVKLIALFVGRIITMKGIYLIQQSARSLPKDITYIFVGDGPELSNLKNSSGSLNNLVFSGNVPHRDIVNYLGASDFLLLPSLAEEAQPYVVMESLTCGRPVITTNRGSVGEMYPPTVGIQIPPTQKMLNRTILKLYKNPSILSQLTRNCRQFAQNRYGIKNAADIVKSYFIQ